MSNKIAVITASAGRRDAIVDPSFVSPHADYYAFTNKEVDCKVWKIMPLLEFSDDKYFHRRNTKLPKILPEYYLGDKYEYVIWRDSTHDLKMDAKDIIDRTLQEHDIAVMQHPNRDCVYEEMKIIEDTKFDSIELIQRQRDDYKADEYPEHKGLYACGLLIRRMTPDIKRLNLLWWHHISKYSSRDQLSFPYCLNKLNIKCNQLKGHITDGNEYLKYMRVH